MKDLEQRLWDLKIPELEDDPLEQSLRKKLVSKYFKSNRRYQVKFRYAVGFACMFAVFFLTSIIKPDIAYNINQFAFQKETTGDESILETDKAEEFPLAKSELNYTEVFDEYERMVSEAQSAAGYNPFSTGELDPAEYREDKTYLIRKYVSQQDGSVMIVSEVPEKPEKQIRKISY